MNYDAHMRAVVSGARALGPSRQGRLLRQSLLIGWPARTQTLVELGLSMRRRLGEDSLAARVAATAVADEDVVAQRLGEPVEPADDSGATGVPIPEPTATGTSAASTATATPGTSPSPTATETAAPSRASETATASSQDGTGRAKQPAEETAIPGATSGERPEAGATTDAPPEPVTATPVEHEQQEPPSTTPVMLETATSATGVPRQAEERATAEPEHSMATQSATVKQDDHNAIASATGAGLGNDGIAATTAPVNDQPEAAAAQATQQDEHKDQHASLPGSPPSLLVQLAPAEVGDVKRAADSERRQNLGAKGRESAASNGGD